MKHIAKLQLSNVDKLSRDKELPVRLCNYVDVYRNDFITADLDFMHATATESQIQDFALFQGDVLITKDSESPNDIAVPAFVRQTLPNIICGYHLAHLRPIGIEGSYLFRAFQVDRISAQFRVAANGITRFGISKSAIGDAFFPVPPLAEQTRIAAFLDEKTAEIDDAIAKKQRLIELLQEQKAILINRAVTRGIDPGARLRESSVAWIGEIPAHWEVKRAKFLFDAIDERSETGAEELLSVSHVTGVTPRSEKNVNMFMAEDYTGSKLCRKDDLVFNIMWAWMGALGVSDRTGIVSASYGVYRQKRAGTFNAWYIEHLLRSTEYVAEYNRRSTGLHSSRLRLYPDMFFDMELSVPPRQEQDRIETVTVERTELADQAIRAVESEIEKLSELRSILISDAVTGKIRV